MVVIWRVQGNIKERDCSTMMSKTFYDDFLREPDAVSTATWNNSRVDRCMGRSGRGLTPKMLALALSPHTQISAWCASSW